MSKYIFKNNFIIIVLFSVFILYFFSFNLYATEKVGHIEGKVTRVYDQNDNYIFATGMNVTSGDRYISQDNIEYKVIKVQEKKAIAEKIGKVNLKEKIEKLTGDIINL